MKNKYHTQLGIGLALLTAIGSANAATILAIDFNNGSSPTETGFIGQNSSGINHTTTAGDITVNFSGQQGTFDRGASGGTNNDFYRDFIFDNFNDSPDMTLTLSGLGIAASTAYEMTFYAYDSGDATRKTGFAGISGTTGTTLGPVISQDTGVPDSLDEYAVTGTFTSDNSGSLTFGIDGLPNGGERTVLNGFSIAAIPEPSAALLGGLGLLALLRRRRD